MYGVIIGISCLMALGVILGSYHYIVLQNQVGILATSYEGIVRIETFQLPFHQAQNFSVLGQDANIDHMRLYAVNGTITIIQSGNQGLYSVV
jgi:hypothetical protein